MRIDPKLVVKVFAAKPPKQTAGAVLGYGRVSRDRQDLAQAAANWRSVFPTEASDDPDDCTAWRVLVTE